MYQVLFSQSQRRKISSTTGLPKTPKNGHSLTLKSTSAITDYYPNMESLFARYLPKDDLDLFAKWAFGPDYLTISQHINFMKAWNALHSGKLHLKPAGNPEEDAPKMVDLWLKERQQGN